MYEGNRVNQQEQKVRRENPKETRVDLPHFHVNENVETYLEWEMKVEQLFTCHHESEERKVPIATLSFCSCRLTRLPSYVYDDHMPNSPCLRSCFSAIKHLKLERQRAP